MELLSVTVTGFKRFKARSSLQTNGKLVAILGPNEAGKSSFLNAIAHLGDSRPLQPEEISRGVDPTACKIVGRFFLGAADLEASGLEGPHWMTITKESNGQRTIGFEPAPPCRNIDHRSIFLQNMTRMINKKGVKSDIEAVDIGLIEDIQLLEEELSSKEETLSSNAISALNDLKVRFEQFVKSYKNSSSGHILDEWGELINLESAPTPLQTAFKESLLRVPEFLFFDEEARNLKSNYPISELRNNVPKALANLAEVAELDFEELFKAIDSGVISRVTTLERRASQVLGRKFRSVWKQSGIDVALRVQGDLLEVQIVNENEEFTAFSERSDGLRQFIALQVFSTRSLLNSPILLIDEAEQRLHYDAQADLVQMLAKQNVSPKIIFTTHSAGCLPEDLGNGVRMVSPIEGDASRIINRFWGEDGRGIAPLLYGMGASTLAFFPTRRAVLVEGPSDMLLYPSLFREVLGQESLGFQFVPGLSNIERSMSPQALRNEVGLVYLVDGDGGGRAIATELRNKGVSQEDIIILTGADGGAEEIEDFIDPDRLGSAVNALIRRRFAHADAIRMSDIRSRKRMEALEIAFLDSTGVKLAKVDLAYELLDVINADPNARLVDPELVQALKSIAQSIAERLERSRAG
jgi:predicted ATP-dependent endonuclease of OLD family